MWESLENLPLLFGFVIAARLWGDNLPAGLAVLVAGMGLGVLVTHFVEPKLHRGNRKVRWASTLVNFLLFVIHLCIISVQIRVGSTGKWTSSLGWLPGCY